MRLVRYILVTISLVTFNTHVYAMGTASGSSGATQDYRTESQTGIERQRTLNVDTQKQKGKTKSEERARQRSESDRSESQKSRSLQHDNSASRGVRLSAISMLVELFQRIERGESADGAVAQKMRQCRLLTEPSAPAASHDISKQPKPFIPAPIVSTQDGGQGYGQWENQSAQITYDWYYGGNMPPIYTVSRDADLRHRGSCFYLYGLLSESVLEELTLGTVVPDGNVQVALAYTLRNMLDRRDLVEEANRRVNSALAQKCVIPTKGGTVRGDWSWHCGSFHVDPREVTASNGNMVVFSGRLDQRDSVLGREWSLEYSQRENVLVASTNSMTNSVDNTVSISNRESSEVRTSKTTGASMRKSRTSRDVATSSDTSNTQSGIEFRGGQ